MSAQLLTTGEGPRARIVLDRLARFIPEMSSGQALLTTLEGLSEPQLKAVAEGMTLALPGAPAPVDELKQAVVAA